MTTHPALDADPAWSPDERALAFISLRTGRHAMFVKDVVSGQEKPLGTFSEPAVIDEWTRDGRFIVFRTLGKAVYAMPLSGERAPRLVADTPYTEDEVHVWPDGRWVAFSGGRVGTVGDLRRCLSDLHVETADFKRRGLAAAMARRWPRTPIPDRMAVARTQLAVMASDVRQRAERVVLDLEEPIGWSNGSGKRTSGIGRNGWGATGPV